jgi:hypothetical protein
MVLKITKTGKPAYLAGRLQLKRENERELQVWGGRTVEIPDYSLETSRAGFVFRRGRLYNSVSRTLSEKMSISMFKEVGERENNYKTGDLTTKERKRSGEPRPIE